MHSEVMALDRNFYIGHTLSGGYRVERFIGSGAFAFVYYAVSPVGKPCAVKIQYNLVDDAKVRFGREIKVLKELPPNDYLVQYFDDGETQEGYPYLIMEFVDGITLKEALKQRPIWPVRECCELILQLSVAFAGLHQLGIAHRDVKPDNIMLTRTHQVKLMDLGLIKDAQGILKLLENEDILNGRDFTENLDKGVLAGTPEYMAPEQFSDPSLDDESKARTDTWTDVYSLGLIFYEMLAGGKLFVFKPNNNSQSDYARSLLSYLKTRTNQNDATIMPPQGVPYQLWTIIARALHADPTLRQRNAREFADDIRRYLTTGEGVVEQDSDKTSAIDLANFAEIMRLKSTNDLSTAQTYDQPVVESPRASQNIPGAYHIPPPGNMPGPYYANEIEEDDNFWLWIVFVVLLIIAAAALAIVVFFL